MHPIPRDGYSYLELIVSLAIVSALAAMCFGPGSASYQHKAKADCARQLGHIAMALSAYATEHHGDYPAVPGAKSAEEPLSLLVPRCTSDTAMFRCPGGKDAELPAGESFAGRKISYAYYMGLRSDVPGTQPLLSDEQVNTAAKRAGEPLFAPDRKGLGAKHRGHGGNVLFCDGHVEAMEATAARDLPVPPGATLLNPRP